ncbi:MAG: N-carbamoyl-D-amino-acid hydrolase [Acidimicrobiia bacterium]|nr:N-carbamoyl-D-amino-acid hydrolase [Acidimicrobiia bacterium]
MTRPLTIAGAQLGPIELGHSRAEVVERLLVLLRDAAGRGAELVVFPELALTTFFPRWWFEDQRDIDAFFERSMPGPDTAPLFDEARRLGVGFSLGYAELATDDDGTDRHFNTTILVERDGSVVTRYRKVHLPGHEEHEPWRAFQHLERGYFEPGPEGFHAHRAFGGVVGLATCNDRRWPETYRVLSLQGAELVLIGYNTPIHYPPDPSQDRLAGFHNELVMAAGAYQNGMWVVGVAKAGAEAGCDLLGESRIIAPSGETVALSTSVGDEVIVAECDLDLCANYKDTLFDFDRYRMIEHYGAITAQRGPIPPTNDEGGPR